MTRFVKILQVEGVVADLINRVRSEPAFAKLEFQNEDYWTDKQHNVNALAHAGDGVFKINLAFAVGENVSEDIDFFEPCIELSGINRKTTRTGERAEDFVRGRFEEGRN